MATLTITNTSSTSPLLLQDFYTTLGAGKSITVVRSASDIPRLTSLMAALNAQSATLSVQYSADEIGSGLIGDSGAAVPAATIQSGMTLFRVAFTAGAGGSAADHTIFAVNDMPAAYRLFNAVLFVGTAVSASTVAVRSTTGGAGTLYYTFSGAATGTIAPTAVNAAPLAVRSSTTGLIVRRSDDGIAGEIYISARAEL